MLNISTISGIGLALVVVLLVGCGAPLPGYYDTLDYRTQADISTAAGPGTTRAFYATNRQRAGSGNRPESYTAARGAGLFYGTCDVRVPRVHHIGSDVVTDQLSRALGRPQPLVVTATNEAANADGFLADFVGAVNATPNKDVVILVHGYNNSFAGPVARAAGLVYDLGEQIVPVAYTWTSQATAQGYLEDENSVDSAARQFAIFLSQLFKAAPPKTRFHLIAHSMGSRVASTALTRLKTSPEFKDNPKPLKNLIFAAADIDADELRARLADDHLTDLADRTTLYAAYNDRALETSERLHGQQYPRAGRAGKSILLAPGVDTIDVSLNEASLVGHGYCGDNRAVINDLFLLIVHDAPPERRNLFHTDQQQARYWLIRP